MNVLKKTFVTSQSQTHSECVCWALRIAGSSSLLYLHKIDFLSTLCYNKYVLHFINTRRYSMNTVKERRLTKKELTEMAKSKLISAQRCAKLRDDYYTVICYGMDSTSLDPARKWIYDQELASGSDHATITANKLVLYVNADELDAMIKELATVNK